MSRISLGCKEKRPAAAKCTRMSRLTYTELLRNTYLVTYESSDTVTKGSINRRLHPSAQPT